MPEGTGAPVQEGDDETPRTISTGECNALNFADTRTDARTTAELEALKRELEREKEERERERRDKDATIADLRARLDASEEERRRKDTQLTALLTDQSRKVATQDTKPKGWLRRFVGT